MSKAPGRTVEGRRDVAVEVRGFGAAGESRYMSVSSEVLGCTREVAQPATANALTAWVEAAMAATATVAGRWHREGGSSEGGNEMRVELVAEGGAAVKRAAVVRTAGQ